MTTSRQAPRKSKNVTPVAAQKATAAPVSDATASGSTASGQPPVPETAKMGAYSWTHDYDYVKKDLRKLGIVSAALFIAIIVAGFFI